MESPVQFNNTSSQSKFVIDQIGSGEYLTHQTNILLKGTVDPVHSIPAILSQRGEFHRTREAFTNQVRLNTNLIRKKTKLVDYSKSSVCNCFISRAKANERLKLIASAISDYTQAIKYDPKCDIAYYNRSVLYFSQNDLTNALDDLDIAIQLRPENVDYLSNRALVLRKMGKYIDASFDVISSRSIDEKIGRNVDSHFFPNHNVSKLHADPVVRCMCIAPCDRTNADNEIISSFLSTVRCFTVLADGDSVLLNHVARNLLLQEYDTNVTIFQQGDYGHDFFIVLEGTVNIVINNHAASQFPSMQSFQVSPGSNYTNISTSDLNNDDSSVVRRERSKIVIRKMYRGDSFGELALQKRDRTRTAGAIAHCPCKIMQMNEDAFLEILTAFKHNQKLAYIESIGRVPGFAEWSEEDIQSLSDRVILQSFSTNSTILSSGEPSKMLYFITKGIVKLTKMVSANNRRHSTPVSSLNTVGKRILGDETAIVPGQWVLEQNWRDTARSHVIASSESKDAEDTEILIDMIGEGQVFGELSVLSPAQESPISAVATSAVDTLVITSDVLHELGAQYHVPTIQFLGDSFAAHNPSLDKILYFCDNQSRWAQQKKSIVKRTLDHKL